MMLRRLLDLLTPLFVVTILAGGMVAFLILAAVTYDPESDRLGTFACVALAVLCWCVLCEYIDERGGHER